MVRLRFVSERSWRDVVPHKPALPFSSLPHPTLPLFDMSSTVVATTAITQRRQKAFGVAIAAMRMMHATGVPPTKPGLVVRGAALWTQAKSFAELIATGKLSMQSAITMVSAVTGAVDMWMTDAERCGITDWYAVNIVFALMGNALVMLENAIAPMQPHTTELIRSIHTLRSVCTASGMTPRTTGIDKADVDWLIGEISIGHGCDESSVRIDDK